MTESEVHADRPEQDVLIPDTDHPLFWFFCPRPTVRILFYTDNSSVQLSTVPDFGVGTLRDLITTHNTFHAFFSVDLINRHDGGHAQRKITPGLLAEYDQVWFFGVEQANQLPFAPENELTDPEVDALRDWMGSMGRQGGVLITGDHSNPRPFGADPALDPLVNLGRALGHRVPRAGKLRLWEGLPSSDFTSPPLFDANTHDTQVPDGIHNLNDLTLQDDSLPQQLLLTKYSLGWGFPFWLRRYRPHPLFCGRSGPIEVYPDHMHEGALDFPSSYPASDWPSGLFGQPRPEVVARGTDKRAAAPGVYDLVSAYDGAQASVGRIVADSTWHHYFNVNLRGFPAGPVLNAIADYYVNLAVWLSPPGVRRAMNCWLWWYLAVHPAVRMVAGNSLALLGQTAFDVLGRRASQCAITEFVWPFAISVEYREKFPWPPEELALGAVINEYHHAFDTALSGENELPDRDELVRRGLTLAYEEHMRMLSRAAEAARGLPEAFDALFRVMDEHRGDSER